LSFDLKVKIDLKQLKL